MADPLAAVDAARMPGLIGMALRRRAEVLVVREGRTVR